MKTELRTLNQAQAGVELRQNGEDEKRTISGYAAVFYDGTPETEFRLDTDFVERIDPGAFDEAIKTNDVRAAYNHEGLLGRTSAGTLTLGVDKRGLMYDIDVPDTTLGRDTVVMMDRGDITGSSFKFRATGEKFDEEDDVLVRTITNVELLDVGPVDFPAYTGTTAEARSGAEEARAAYLASKTEDDAKLKAKLRQVQTQARIVEIS